MSIPNRLKKKYKNLEKEGVIINSKRFPPGTSHGNHFLEIRKLKNEKDGFEPGYYAFILFNVDKPSSQPYDKRKVKVKH